MSLTPAAMRRLMKEMALLRTTPPDGIRITTNEEDMLDFIGIIAGPEGTPYEGGYFRVRFQFTEEFPTVPPKCTLLTKIFHPNVSKSGEICVNTLKKDWSKDYGIQHILVTIKCLLIYPNAESALDEAAGKLLLENYDEYFKHAKVITSVHAKPKVRPPEFDIPSAVDGPSTSSISSTSHTSGPSRTGAGTNPVEPSPKQAKTVPPSSSNLHLPAEPTEPLQPSPSNNSSHLPLSTATSSSIVSAAPFKSPSVHKDSTIVGPLQPTGGNGSSKSLKRTAATGGVAKRKKGLKRL